jgi:hypothetical protein
MTDPKEIHPPVIPMGPRCMNTSRSKKGLKIPMNRANGETINSFLNRNPSGRFAIYTIRMGKKKKGTRLVRAYLGKETTAKTKVTVASSFALGSRR